MKDKDLVLNLKRRVGDLEEKVSRTEKLAKSVVTYVREVNLQVDAVVGLLTEKKLILEGEHEKAFDLIRGLRKRGSAEKIENGDTVWVSFKTKLPNGNDIEEEDFPVRVGAKAVAFETALVGRHPENSFSTDIEFPKDYFSKDVAGHKLTFHVNVGKVKCKINAGKEMETASGR